MNDASEKVALPGLLLAITGGLSLLLTALSAIFQLVSLVPALMAALDAGTVVDFLMMSALSLLPFFLSLTIATICSVLVIMAGMRLRSTRSPLIIYLGSILAMIPCCTACCPLGLFTGGWVLFVMQDDDVRAAMADG